MNDDLERGIADWIGSRDRPIPIEDVIAGRRSWWPAWLPVPVAAAGAMVIVLLAAAVVLAGGGDPPEGDVETAAPTTNTTTTDTSLPEPRPSSTTTASTSTTLAIPPTPDDLPPPDDDAGSPAAGGGTAGGGPGPSYAPPCEELRSDAVWGATRSTARDGVAAGRQAQIVERITNEGPAVCSFTGDSCRGDIGLADPDGTPRRSPVVRACPAAAQLPQDLAPGETTERAFWVGLHSPPGDYVVDVPDRQGGATRLQVQLAARHPACATADIEIDDRPQSLSSGSLWVSLGAPDDCSLRLETAELVLDPDGDPSAYVDEWDTWLVADGGLVTLYLATGPVAEPPGEYPARVIVTFEGGEQIEVEIQVTVR